jgi:hypothetical protein
LIISWYEEKRKVVCKRMKFYPLRYLYESLIN